MDQNERMRLQKLYGEFSDDGLIEMLKQDSAGYEAGVYDVLLEEARRRNIPQEQFQPLPQPAAALEQPGGAMEQPAQEGQFRSFMSVETEEDRMFVEGVFRASHIPYYIQADASGQGFQVMVQEGWLKQAEELFQDEAPGA
ncbi:MAG TPA: hypothetical protein P5110_09745 [Candidatus Omnitrophota bacterium]|nr:hypothetical protein [Candidatus Omnitrophota bacterium]HRZ15777.1 hypothetical protein [Candidatus Omnitrophota bacterium]